MTEGQALYQSILERPEDDAPRLVYSDWLEENGQSERAAFIRVQCELARAEPYSPLFRKLTAKSRRLFRPQWLQSLRGKTLHAEMHRGFIHKVTMYSKRFVMDGGETFDTEPVREVKFADFSAVRGNVPVATLAVCPHLRRLTGLTVSGQSVTGRMFDELLDGGNLRGLKKLSFDQTNIEAGMYRRILLASRLPLVEELQFNLFQITDAGWQFELSESDLLRQLQGLSFSVDQCFARPVGELVKNPALENLRRLKVFSRIFHDGHGVAEPLLASVNQSRHLGKLRDLDLAMTNVDDRDLTAFVANARFACLRRLNLPLNRITGVGAQAILNAEHLRGLYYLNLDANHITSKSRWKELLRKWCPEAIVRVN